MYYSHKMFDIIIDKLNNIQICKEIGIPFHLSLEEKFVFLRYSILEFWDKQEIDDNLRLISGMFLLARFKAFLIKGIPPEAFDE